MKDIYIYKYSSKCQYVHYFSTFYTLYTLKFYLQHRSIKANSKEVSMFLHWAEHILTLNSEQWILLWKKEDLQTERLKYFNAFSNTFQWWEHRWKYTFFFIDSLAYLFQWYSNLLFIFLLKGFWKSFQSLHIYNILTSFF